MKFSIGQTASLTRFICKDDVWAFARLSGDLNPLHIDETYAAKTRFGRCIVHGALTTGLISAVLGTELPGLGTVYLRQDLRFVKPVYVNDAVTAKVTITEIIPEKGVITLQAVCTNHEGALVIEGDVVVFHESARVR